jgi:hypothetical protein
MVDLVAWAQSAEVRLRKYQEDRGQTATDRPRLRSSSDAMREVRNAGAELRAIADQVPPV